jgi:hypothetical protein
MLGCEEERSLVLLQLSYRKKKKKKTASVVEFLATDSEVPGSIPGATRFSEEQWAGNWVHSAS